MSDVSDLDKWRTRALIAEKKLEKTSIALQYIKTALHLPGYEGDIQPHGTLIALCEDALK